jgi:tetrahedral aminopeptidase
MKLLEELCQTPGVPGREQKIIDIMTRELKSVTDEVKVDSFGNVVGIKRCKKAKPLRVMIAGHMDEIGFVVSFIDDKGFIYFSGRGGHIPKNIQSQRVKIYGKKTLFGVIESTTKIGSPTGRNELPEISDMYVDTGFSKAQLSKMIEVGDPIVMDGDFLSQGDTLMSKAFDNRVGCYVVLETMKRVKNKNLNCEVYALGSAQEEVGVRGARSAAKQYNPDLGVALDITAAFDTPGVAPQKVVTKLGDGVAIKINDMGAISNHGLVKHFRALAKKHKIKYQDEILPFGGTDAMGMQLFGSGAVGCLSIPTRNAHSANEMINTKDLEACIQLLVKFLETAHLVKLEF